MERYLERMLLIVLTLTLTAALIIGSVSHSRTQERLETVEWYSISTMCYITSRQVCPANIPDTVRPPAVWEPSR